MGQHIVCHSGQQEVFSIIQPVLVHVYNIGLRDEIHAMNRFLRTVGSGAFHCGVEINGREWSFSQSGITWCKPRECKLHTFSESILMGHAELSKPDVDKILLRLEKEWLGRSYDVVRRNCCHFCNRFCALLGVDALPDWATNLAVAAATIADTEEQFTTVVCKVSNVVCNHGNECGFGDLWSCCRPSCSSRGSRSMACVLDDSGFRRSMHVERYDVTCEHESSRDTLGYRSDHLPHGFQR